MKFHPYSEAWRLLKGAEFDDLVADIKEHGLREKIWLYQGQILDGRNRYRACEKAGIKPQYREFKGSDPISFSISLNKHRRHDSESERAFAAARIADMRSGQRTDLGSQDSRSIQEAADEIGTSRSSAVRAKRILKKGSKALQQAAEAGEVPLKKAAAVVDLPKSEQLAAAKSKPAPKVEDNEPERPEWEPEEDEKFAAIEREIGESTERVMRADDKLAAAHIEIKRQAAEIAGLKSSRDHYQSETGAAVRIVKQRDKQIEKLEREMAKVKAENESLNERIAIMEAA